MGARKLADQLFLDNWPRRRRWMKLILTWAICNAQYLIVFGKDTGLHMNALVALLSLIFAILGSYVFGAAWDDQDKRRHLNAVPVEPVEEE